MGKIVKSNEAKSLQSGGVLLNRLKGKDALHKAKSEITGITSKCTTNKCRSKTVEKSNILPIGKLVKSKLSTSLRENEENLKKKSLMNKGGLKDSRFPFHSLVFDPMEPITKGVSWDLNATAKEKKSNVKNSTGAAEKTNAATKRMSLQTIKSSRKHQNVDNEKKATVVALQPLKTNKSFLKHKILSPENRRDRATAGKDGSGRPLESQSFDEKIFQSILNIKNIRIIAEVLTKQVKAEVATKNKVIFGDYTYFLNISSFHIADYPKRMVKLSLKHSMASKDGNTVIIVADMQRGSKFDHDPTIAYYEDVFREAGIEGLKIVPFRQLKTECGTYQALRNFRNTYDYFLCDARIVRHATGFCGKNFQKPRSTLHPVRLAGVKNIKNEIEKSLHRTAYRFYKKGNLISIPVGTEKSSMKHLAENICHVVGQLKGIYPGGLENIRSMHLKMDIVGTSSFPLYISTSVPPLNTPYVIGEREKRLLAIKREADAVLGKFVITKEAQIKKLSKFEVERNERKKATKLAVAMNSTREKDDVVIKIPAKKTKKNITINDKANVKSTGKLVGKNYGKYDENNHEKIPDSKSVAHRRRNLN